MFKIILAALILYFTPSLALSISGCGENKFKCNDGQCIGIDLKCNGQVDCRDKSDETFVTCYNNTCRPDQFRCNYGGCIKNITRCQSEEPGCLDGTHNSKYDCGDDELIDQIYEKLRGNCSMEYALKCGTKCIKWSQVCDGIVDCQGSDDDEELEMCASSFCPNNSFRCMTGACIGLDSLCNHHLDCNDGSDELPEICNPAPIADETGPVKNDEPKSNVWKTNTCKLNIKNGTRVQDYFLDFSYKNGAHVPENGVVEIKCDRGYINYGMQINKCKQGQWENRYFNCTRQCEQLPDIRQTHYKTQCTRGHNLVDCEHNMQQYETYVNVTCARGYETKDSNGQHICDEHGNWTTVVPSPQCTAICGKISPHHSNLTPWTVSIFERSSEDNSIHDFVCLGTIVSSHVVVTAEECFSKHSNKEKEKSLYYTVVEGDHRISYETNEDTGYLTHNIKRINIIKSSSGVRKYIAALSLIKPFEFGARVRPICLDTNMTSEPSNNVNDWTGEGLTTVKGDIHILTHIVGTNKEKHDIKRFSIMTDIRESEKNL